MRHMVSISQAHIGELVGPLPGHLADQGSLPVHHLVM